MFPMLLSAIRQVLYPTEDVKAKRILKKYALTVFDPSTSTCYSDSAGSLPCAKDDVIGRIACSNGSGFYATQPTAGYKPKLRKGAVNLFVGSDNCASTMSVAGVGVTAPALVNASLSGPFGETNASSYSFAATSGIGQQGMLYKLAIASPVPVGITYTFSVYLKSISGNATCYIGLSEVGSPEPGTFVACALTSSWQRFQVTRTTTKSTGMFFEIGPDTRTTFDSPQTAVQSAGVVGIFGAMLSLGTTAEPYVATTTVPLSNGVGSWWMDFDGVDDYLQLNAVPWQQADRHYVSAVAKSLSSALLSKRIFYSGTDGDIPRAPALGFDNTANNNLSAFWRDDASANISLGGLDTSVNKTGKIVCYSLGFDGIRHFSRSASKMQGSSEAVLGTTSLTHACIGASTSYLTYLKGAIYSLILGRLNSQISESEMKTIEKFFSKKAGLSL